MTVPTSSGQWSVAGHFARRRTLFALVSLVTGLVVSVERPWTRIAVRVAGFWIVVVARFYQIENKLDAVVAHDLKHDPPTFTRFHERDEC